MSVFHLTVVLTTGLSFLLKIYPSDSFRDIKERIAVRMGYPAEKQRLIYLGRGVCEDRSVSDYNVRKDTKLNVVLRIRSQTNETHKAPQCNNKYVKIC